jgi:iron complex outermembrane receptor protein
MTQDLAGRRLDGAPRLTTTIFAQYAHGIGWRDVEMFYRGDYTYTSMVYLAQDLDSNLLQGPTHLANLRWGVRDSDRRWEATLWVTNVADQRWFVTGFDVPVLSGYGVVMAPPRQVGFTIRINL